ncbi:MAG: xanthine dehydrogenase family protein molybdopterin-binding subunit [Pseudomonadota bacterium]|nr:xanthine dehydrogenase family protein molybdopterin-binding subunit [Pseudomonadota bacterium]
MGQGQYVDDIRLPFTAVGYVLRSPYPHARVNGINADAAKEAPGVLLVLTGADAEAQGLGTIHCHVPPMAFGGPPSPTPAHPILVRDRVRCVGDPVAFIVAETLAQAKDAAEMIEVEYEALPSVGSTREAVVADAPQVWEENAGNLWFEMDRGDAAATDAAFDKATHVVRADLHHNRISANAMEPRAALAEYSTSRGEWTCYMSSQGTHQHRPTYAEIFHQPATAFRVIAPDVGGGFGMKNGVFPEDALVAWAARELGRPVKWTGDRSESLVSDTHGRDAECDSEMALDENGKILAIRVKADYGLGAYLSASAPVPACIGSMVYQNVYEYEAMHIHIRVVFSHTTWTGPYRGAGRPEAVYVVERLLDIAADEIGIDPVEIRNRNYIAKDKMPFTTLIPTVYDSGDFAGITEHAAEITDLAGFEKRKEESAARGKLRGIGACSFIDFASPFNDRMEIRFDDTGAVTVVAGTHSHGQGHQTTYAQMIHSWLGVPFDKIRLVQGDSDKVTYGRGTYGSRSMTIGGSALRLAADKIIEKAKKIAAHVLEAAEEDIEFANGNLTVAGTDKSMHICDMVPMSYMPMGWPGELGIGLEAEATWTPETGPNWPNGTHFSEVEIDPETGFIELVRHIAVNDSGEVINPLLLAGQVHGGVAQGVGQALMEDVTYDRDGQILAGSFLDYCMPRADDLPMIHTSDFVEACQTNPLGVKGGGESGTVGSTAAVVNAIVDALSDYGVKDIDMPVSPLRVWQAMQGGKAA